MRISPRRASPVLAARYTRLAAVILLAACSGGGLGDPRPAGGLDVPAPPPADPTPATTPPAPIATCPVAAPRPEPIDARAVADVDVVAGKRWLVVQIERAPTLLHLDARGQLARMALPAWTEDIAAEPDALRLLRTPDPATWWRLDLRDPDVPTLGPAAAIPGLVPGEYPKGFASDGARALVSMYRESTQPGPRHRGDTFLLDVATGARVGPRADMTVWTAVCDRGACYGVATPEDDLDLRALVALDERGARRLGALGRWDCTGLVTWREGQTWTIAWSERRAVGLAAVDLASGATRTAQIPTDDADCAELRGLEIDGHHGLLLTATRSGRAFVSIGADLRPGVPEPLPPLTGARQRFADLGDAVLVADYTATRGLQKDRSPDPDGKIEYDEVWRFSGRAGLLRRGAAGWTLDDVVPLPHDGEDGRMAGGYDVHLLTRPGHAGVLLSGDGLTGAYVALREPCREPPDP